MRLNYKRLGDYIRQVDFRNKDLVTTNLLGISINKYFMPSVANVIGTDLSKYKLIAKNQFACNPMHVGRDGRLPVALFSTEEFAIVSPAYFMFEITEQNLLLPEYLMMWLMRPEFDRYCTFKTDSSVRGGIEWSEICDVTLPVPDINVQQQIVDEYNTVKKRIDLNERLIKTLEETAQAIYKQWFVDFEFPDENGKPYKSNGGKMVDSELGEIPAGWEVGTVKEFCKEMKSGGTPDRGIIEYWKSGNIPWLKTGEVGNCIVTKTEEFITKLGYEGSSAKLLPHNTVLMAMYGATAAQVALLKIEASTNQACCGMICNSIDEAAFLYEYFIYNQKEIATLANGGAQPNLSKNIIEALKILIGPERLYEESMLKKIIDKKYFIAKLNDTLEAFIVLLLSKLSTVEGLE